VAGRPDALSTRLAGWLRARVAELRMIRLPARTGAIAAALMLGSWFCDIAVLGVAYAAVGTSPPWAGLLLAYCAGHIASALPVTPAGSVWSRQPHAGARRVRWGRVDHAGRVLMYRLIAYWACIPLGGLAWLLLRVSAGPERALPVAEPALQGIRDDPAPERPFVSADDRRLAVAVGDRRLAAAAGDRRLAAGAGARLVTAVRGRPLLTAVRVLAALVVLAALDGCASPGGGATAHNDVARCAAVLPLARDVVHGQGTLTLVRPVDRATWTRSPSRPAWRRRSRRVDPARRSSAHRAGLCRAGLCRAGCAGRGRAGRAAPGGQAGPSGSGRRSRPSPRGPASAEDVPGGVPGQLPGRFDPELAAARGEWPVCAGHRQGAAPGLVPRTDHRHPATVGQALLVALLTMWQWLTVGAG